jgi:membrane-associated phospholipid phosphatase
LLTFFYRAAGGTVFLFFDQFFDARLTAFERAVLGVNPTLYIDRHLLNPVLNELFSLGYFLYYPLIPVFMLAVFLRRDMDILRSSLSAVCLTFFLSYPLFFLYPIEGPRWFFADRFINTIESPVARPAVDFVIDNAAFHGGCVPSSHFAVALVILLYCRRYYRGAYRWVLPVVATMAIGTVWGRFHYVSDVVVGGIIGIVVTLLFWNRPGTTSETAPKESERELAAHHAS